MRHRGGLDQSSGGRDGRSRQTVDVFWKFDGTAVDMWHGGAVRATEAIPSNGERARGLQGVRLSPDPELLPVAEVLLGLGEGGGGTETIFLLPLEMVHNARDRLQWCVCPLGQS